jgi:hypothetical protein
MISPVLGKRLVAAVAMLAMLLCQSAALAQACSGTAAPPDGAAKEQPCHAGSDPAQQPGEAAEAGCLISSPSAQTATFFYDVTDLPAIRVSARLVDAPAQALFAAAPLLRTEPPPLRIVHCCLRN